MIIVTDIETFGVKSIDFDSWQKKKEHYVLIAELHSICRDFLGGE